LLPDIDARLLRLESGDDAQTNETTESDKNED
jgi:hypothetical protein